MRRYKRVCFSSLKLENKQKCTSIFKGSIKMLGTEDLGTGGNRKHRNCFTPDAVQLYRIQRVHVMTEQRVVEVCQGRQLRLVCPRGRVIQLVSVQLADSRCLGANCCPRPSDCAAAASTAHQTMAINSCNRQRSCSLSTERRRIPCGFANFPVNNDYERITYHCIGTEYG